MEETTREKWTKRIEQWRESGLTAKEFAAEAGLNAGTLAYWKYRLGADHRQDGKPATRGRVPGRKPVFVEVVAPTGRNRVEARSAGDVGTVDAGAIEVVLGNGIRIRVPPTFVADALARVVAAVGGR
jgi:hypothetical protein